MAVAKKTRIKTEAAKYPVPQNKPDVTSAILHLGNLQGERQRRRAELDDEISRLKADYDGVINPINEKMRGLVAGIQTYCEANRTALTNQGKTKTATFVTGEVSWRTRPPSVRIRNNKTVMAAIKELGLGDQLLRTREEVDKESMLKNPDKAGNIPGVTIESTGEDFIVKPSETKLEEVCKK